MAATEEQMRSAYTAWLDGIEASGRTPPLEAYLMWAAWDDNLPYRLGTPHLVNLLEQAIERGEDNRLARTKVRHILSSGYACHSCFIDDLRQAVGLDPVHAPHEEHL